MTTAPAAIELDAVTRRFALHTAWRRDRAAVLTAVDRVSLEIAPREIVALVGESGSGKTTLGRIAVGLDQPTAGSVKWFGEPATPRAVRRHRQRVQMIFQDPFGSLNPKQSVGSILRAPLLVHRLATRRTADAAVAVLLESVGLPASFVERWPVELSGGQQQRVAIARALSVNPDVIVADEPVAALDVSVRAQVTNLLLDIQSQHSLAMLFISHDLAILRHLASLVVVMYLGRTMEVGPTEAVLADARHPYTSALVSAAPVPDPRLERDRRRIVLKGDPPSPVDPPTGCVFHTRCPVAQFPLCATEEPALRTTADGHGAACHFA